MEVNFRSATTSDLNTLLNFMREYYEYDALTFDETAAHTSLEQILRDDSVGLVWLISWLEEVIGYVVLTLGYSLEYHGRDAFLDELYIRASYRGCGVGTKTLQFLEELCSSLNIHALHLEVERRNTRAQSFYRRIGFEEHNRYLMTKWIPNSAARNTPL